MWAAFDAWMDGTFRLNVLVPLVSIILPLAFPVMGILVTRDSMEDCIAKQYGSINVASEILRARSFFDKLMGKIPERHVSRCMKAYKHLRVALLFFQFDLVCTILFLIANKAYWFPPADYAVDLRFSLGSVIKAIFGEAFVFLYVVFLVPDVSPAKWDSTELMDAEFNPPWARKQLEKLKKKDLTPEEYREKEKEYLDMIEENEKKFKEIREKLNCMDYDGNPY